MTTEIDYRTDTDWDLYYERLRDLNYRINDVREMADNLDFHVERDDELPIEDLLALYDKVNVLIATAISGEHVVDGTGATVTFDDWDNFTKPAIGADEVVVRAAEYDREIDNAYFDGVSDTWDDAYSNGLNDGIRMASRVLNVLNARIVDATALRD